jgi:hypothetical protein
MSIIADLEKQSQLHHTQVNNDSATASVDTAHVDPRDTGETQVSAIRENNGILRLLVSVEKHIDRLTKFEAMGVERIPEDQRSPPQKLNVSYNSSFHPLEKQE